MSVSRTSPGASTSYQPNTVIPTPLSQESRVASIGERSIKVDDSSSTSSIVGRFSMPPIPNTTKCRITKCDGQIIVWFTEYNDDGDLDRLSAYLNELVKSGYGDNIQIGIRLGAQVSIDKLARFMCTHRKHLHILDVTGINIDDGNLKLLLNYCENLIHLHVRSSKVTEEGLSGLHLLRKLEILGLAGCVSVKALTVPNFQTLEILDLCDCKSLVSLSLPDLLRLKYLYLRDCTLLSSVTLAYHPELLVINFQECISLTSQVLANFVKLQIITLNGCENLASLTLSNLPELTHLGLNRCRLLVSLTLPELPKLDTFDISRTSPAVFAQFAPLLSDLSRVMIKKTRE